MLDRKKVRISLPGSFVEVFSKCYYMGALTLLFLTSYGFGFYCISSIKIRRVFFRIGLDLLDIDEVGEAISKY